MNSSTFFTYIGKGDINQRKILFFRKKQLNRLKKSFQKVGKGSNELFLIDMDTYDRKFKSIAIVTKPLSLTIKNQDEFTCNEMKDTRLITVVFLITSH